MKNITGNILDIKKGVICQQVNCSNAYGAGISGKISKVYPKVEQAYRSMFDGGKTVNDVFGLCQPVTIDDDLTVVNIFSQKGYSNAYKTGIVSTDMDTLVSCLKRICDKYSDRDIYVPHGIGCGLAGGNWKELCERCEHLPITVVCLP